MNPVGFDARALLVACALATTAATPRAAVAPKPPLPTRPAPPRPSPPNTTADEVWVGTYTCAQGLTELTLRVTAGDGAQVRAVFDFVFAPRQVHGAYRMAGARSADGHTTLAPAAWITRPLGYVTVGMDGAISADGQRFDGSITEPGCTTFHLRRVR